MMMMTEKMATAALIEGVVKCPQIEEAMVVEDHQVHIVGIGVALIMGMELFQVLDMRLGEVLTMVELKALSMKDIRVVQPHHEKDLDLEKEIKHLLV